MKNFTANNNNNGGGRKKVVFRGRHKRQETHVVADELPQLLGPQVLEQHDMLLAEIVRSNIQREDKLTLMRSVCRIYALDQNYALDFYNSHFQEHAGENTDETVLLFDMILKSMHMIKQYCGNNEGTIRRVESTLVAAWAVFRFRDDMTKVTLHVVQYIMAILPRSITTTLTQCIQKIFESNVEQSLANDILRECNSDYANVFKNLMSRPCATHARTIASLLCTIGLVEPKCWNIKGFEVFTIEAFDDKRISMIDILDSTLASITFFFERGYMCFVEKNLRPMFVTSDRMMELEVSVEKLAIEVQNHCQGSDRKDFAVLCTSIYSIADRLRNALLTVKPIEAVIVRRLLRMVLSLENDVIRAQQSETLRIAPYCVKIWGTSGVGKTSFNLITIRETLRYNGYAYDDANINKIEPEKEYWENIKNDTTGITIDDMCNTIHTKEKVNPADILIKVVNNQPQSVNRADIVDKGKIWIDAKVVGITTNNRSLAAEHWSVEPMSIVRRCNLHVDLKVKPEYADDNGQLDQSRAENAPRDGYIQDLWDISVFQVKRKNNSKLANMAEDYELHFAHDEYGEMKNVNIKRYLMFLYDQTKTHFKWQKEFIHSQKLSNVTVKCCNKCNMIQSWCQCAEEAKTEVNVETEQSFISEYVGMQYFVYLMSFLNVGILGSVGSWLYYCAGFAITCKVIGILQAAIFPTWYEKKIFSILSRKQTNVWSRNIILSIDNFIDFNIAYLPAFISESSWCQYIYMYWHRRAIYNRIRVMCCYSLITTTCFVGAYWYIHRSISWQVAGLYMIYCMFWILFQAYLTYIRIYWRLQHVRAIGRESRFNTWRYDTFSSFDNFFTIAGFAHNLVVCSILITTIEVIRAGIRLYTANEARHEEDHGGVLSPGTVEEAERREVKTNIWSHTIQTPNKSTRTVNDFINTCKKNLLVIKITSVTTDTGSRDVSTYCNALMLTGGVVMLPLHMVYERSDEKWLKPYISCRATFIRSETVNSGWSEELTFSRGHRIEGHDLILFPVYGGGQFKSIVDHVGIKPTYNGVVRIVKRQLDGSIDVRPGNVVKQEMMQYTRGDVSMNWHGIHTRTSSEWMRGDCISLILSDDSDPRIIGFHLIGTADLAVGISVSLPTAQLRSVVNTLSEHYIVHSAEDIETKVYDVDIQFSPTVHHKSPVNFIEHRNLTVLGSVGGGRTPKTKVRESIAAPFLENILGPQLYGPPSYKGFAGNQSWLPWYNNLAGTANVSTTLPVLDLDFAVRDYERGLSEIIAMHKSKIKPLSEEVVVNGMPHSRFMTGLNRDTSMGFPLGKAKSNYMEITRIEPDGRKIYAFSDSRIWQRWYTMEDELASGKIPTSIFKATLKDEPTKLTKEKVRVFQAADIGMQLGVRKFFLPIIRALCLHPLLSECAVGINPFSLEWDALDNHVSKFGRSRIIAGDYKGWDTTLPAVLVYRAMCVLIHFAEMTGNYCARDICVMRGLAAMLCNPLINFNGTLIKLHGTTPSGHNLTSVLNSICNSLLLRCSFYRYHNYEDKIFRDYVSNITYGDDFVAGVSQFTDFSLVIYEKYLFTHTGICVTMPDKTSEIIPYMEFDDVDFLKRKSTYIERLGVRIGVLDLQSIHKSLYTTMSSPGDERNVLVSVVHSAMHEVFYHGPIIYDKYIKIFKDMFDYLELDPGPIYKSYEERALEWEATYREQRSVLDDGRVDDTLADTFNGIAPDTT